MIADPFSLADRVAVITGGTGAIGSALAAGLARAGASVAVLARSHDDVARAGLGCRIIGDKLKLVVVAMFVKHYGTHVLNSLNKAVAASEDVALDRIARLMKDDRDKNFIARNNDGVTVNRWLTTGFLAASATSNETACSLPLASTSLIVLKAEPPGAACCSVFIAQVSENTCLAAARAAGG